MKQLKIATETRSHLGGLVDIRRPRESGPFPLGQPSFDSASLTFGGTGEVATAMLAEAGFATDWSILDRD